MDNTFLDRIRDLIESRPDGYVDQLYDICSEMEEFLGPTEMWNTLKPGFSTDELASNLEYIARECDI